MPSLDQFRRQVVNYSLFEPSSLDKAIQQLGFVQADPIRSPARAQDLILRHRVKNYKVGDLERSYPQLKLEECFLYAHGFLSEDLWRIIYPNTYETLTNEQQTVLDLVRQYGPMHPKELESHIGGERVQNYWGGYSRSAKMEMESLHERGALRVAHRNKGFRIYGIATSHEQTLSNQERYKEIIVATLKAMGATTQKFLLRELSHFKYLVEPLKDRRKHLQELIKEGRVRVDLINAVEYLSVDEATKVQGKRSGVQILAPFDPIVRDRTRFEHLWNWTYRFEAYTPTARRKLGYYAMPVLWQNSIIGWANATVEGGRLKVHFGYATEKPDRKRYSEEAEQEVIRLATFLGLKGDCWEACI